ncbi:peptidoglycan DD-metalloendopeptidase family protein [Sneathiella sp.]|uniref:peptidoglycan DD-metalloendopeptidase family protein n=1 Tax=Sneathiella sp. TaxID=1964365 RepID=UPI0039E67832
MTASVLLIAGASGCVYDLYLPPEGSAQKNASSSFQAQRSGKIQPVSDISNYPNGYYKKLAYQLVTVQPGDTLSKIALRYDIPTPSVIALNNSQPPYLIRVGQKIKIPYFRIHRVRGGETLYALSKVYDVSVAELIHFNHLEKPYILRPAMALRVPERDKGELRVASVDAKTWPVTRAASHYEKEEIVLVRPQPQKTNKDLSNKQVAPAAQPREKKPAQEYASLSVNPVSTAAAAESKPKPVPLAVPVVKSEPVELGGTEIKKSDLPPLPRSRYSIKHPPNRSGKIFIWPVKGKLLSGYGRKKNGLHNDGINILVADGTPVRAAENGIVSYVGNEMRSFGNLILISHADGYVTTYGHTSEILVSKGDVVRKGDVIARAGSTGDVETTQLHFEIRKEGTALNPAVHLASR